MSPARALGCPPQAADGRPRRMNRIASAGHPRSDTRMRVVKDSGGGTIFWLMAGSSMKRVTTMLQRLHRSPLSCQDVVSLGNAFVRQCSDACVEGWLQRMSGMIQDAMAARTDVRAAARAVLDVVGSILWESGCLTMINSRLTGVSPGSCLSCESLLDGFRGLGLGWSPLIRLLWEGQRIAVTGAGCCETYRFEVPLPRSAIGMLRRVSVL
jgi:hypothetical protein